MEQLFTNTKSRIEQKIKRERQRVGWRKKDRDRIVLIIPFKLIKITKRKKKYQTPQRRNGQGERIEKKRAQKRKGENGKRSVSV